ncbi:MAG: Sec-independent protein translocase protein TatB, partial [Gammaproteobacteria bacterium]|nr:Sec-independent protein translocase protein TatB [Gammaproteobacteria bacterium]
MFDIGFPELMLVAIVGLLVIGPNRLPEALRTLGLWLGRMRRSFNKPEFDSTTTPVCDSR